MADIYHLGNELNNYSTTLVNAIAAGDGSMELADIGALATPPAGERMLLTIIRASDPTVVEIVNVTDVTGSVVSMDRNQEGSGAKGWNAGDIVQARPTAGMLNAFKQGLAEEETARTNADAAKLSKTGDVVTSVAQADDSTAATDLDWSAAMVFVKASDSFTFSGLPTEYAERTLIITGGDVSAPDLPVSYVGGSEPTWTERDIVRLFKLPGDSTVWLEYVNTMPIPAVTFAISPNEIVSYSGISADLSSWLTTGFMGGLHFSPNGTKMYTSEWSSAAKVHQWTLTTPGTLSGGISYDGSIDLVSAVADEEVDNAHDMDISADGTKLYIYDSSWLRVTQYSLTVAHDITGGHTRDGKLDIIDGDYFTLNDDGTALVLVDYSADEAYQYDLPTPWDITASPTYVGPADISGILTSGGPIQISPSWETLIIVNRNTSRQVHQVAVTTPGDITGGLTGVDYYYAGDVGDDVDAIHFRADGGRFWLGRQDAPAGVYEYDVT